MEARRRPDTTARRSQACHTKGTSCHLNVPWVRAHSHGRRGRSFLAFTVRRPYHSTHSHRPGPTKVNGFPIVKTAPDSAGILNHLMGEPKVVIACPLSDGCNEAGHLTGRGKRPAHSDVSPEKSRGRLDPSMSEKTRKRLFHSPEFPSFSISSPFTSVTSPRLTELAPISSMSSQANKRRGNMSKAVRYRMPSGSMRCRSAAAGL